MRKGLLILIGILAVAVAGLLFVPKSPPPAASSPENEKPPAEEKEVVLHKGRPVPEPPTSAPRKETPLSPRIPPVPPPSSADATLSPEQKAARAALIAKNARPDPRTGRSPDGRTILTEAVKLARLINSPDQPPEDDVANLDEILRNYRLVHRTNPEGTNDEIIATLAGDNPRRVIFFDSNHPDIDADGRLLDRWGQPFYFHALSSTDMEIWSGGPDGKRGNRDDIRIDSPNRESLQLNIEAP